MARTQVDLPATVDAAVHLLAPMLNCPLGQKVVGDNIRVGCACRVWPCGGPKANQNQLASSDSTIDGLRWLKNGVARRALMSQTRAIIYLMRLNFPSVF